MNTQMALQERIMAFVRTFGLHQPDQTPCGQPITVAEAYTLMELSHEEMLPQFELIERLNLAKSTVSRLVTGLVKRGWIECVPNPADKRSKLLQLTPAGRKVAQATAAARQEKFAGVLEHIPEDQQEHVTESLNILVEAIRESNKQAIT